LGSLGAGRQFLSTHFCSGLTQVSRLCRTRWFLFYGVVSLAIFGAQPKANAQYTILYNFGPEGAVYPGIAFSAPNGNIFGTCGKKDNLGKTVSPFTVFEWNPTTNVANTIYSFPNAEHRGGSISFLYKRAIIGTAAANKKYPAVVFRLGESAPATPNILHSFGVGVVTASFEGPDGDIYGTTEWGGSYNSGTVYQLDPTSHKVTIIHSFDPNTEPYIPVTGLLLGNDGNYYGTSDFSPSFDATIYKVSPDGTLTTLYTFSDSYYYLSALIQGSDGNFYGTTGGGYGRLGWLGYGNIYQMTPSGSVTILHTFQQTDGADPGVLIQGPPGYLYGLASTGGLYGDGVLFELSTDGSSYTILHNFGDPSVPNDGQGPSGLITGSDSNLYGSTVAGGTNNDGTLYEITP
jgi:uncharacterized repeat protein (TIGR03803 family)